MAARAPPPLARSGPPRGGSLRDSIAALSSSPGNSGWRHTGHRPRWSWVMHWLHMECPHLIRHSDTGCISSKHTGQSCGSPLLSLNDVDIFLVYCNSLKLFHDHCGMRRCKLSHELTIYDSLKGSWTYGISALGDTCQVYQLIHQ